METSWRSCAICKGKGASGHGQGEHGHPQPPGWGHGGPRPGPCTQGLLPPLWPTPAAPPGARCAQSGSGSASAGTARCAPPAPGPAPSARGRAVSARAGACPLLCPNVPGVPPAPSPSPCAGWAPTYLIQQVGDSINVVVGLCDPDRPLSAQDWGRRAKGEPLQCGTTGPGAQHCPPPRPPTMASHRRSRGCFRWHKAAPRWSPQRTFYLLGSTSRGAGQGQAAMLTAVTAPREMGCSHLTPPTLPTSWGTRKDAELRSPWPPPHPDTVPAPPQDTQAGRRDGERQAAETGSEVTSPAKSRLERQYK